MGDINPEQQLTEKSKNCQKTARNLKEENESLLQKQKLTETTGDSDHSVKPSPIVDDVNKQLMDSEFAMESSQQQAQVSFQQYDNTQTTLPTFVDRSSIQSDDKQKQIAQVKINQQDKLSDDNNGQNKAKLNSTSPEPQALFTGTLPDDFFLHLMSVIGIQECLLSNRLVCSFWNGLVLERCGNQKSLKLFETFKCLIRYGEWLLEYEKTEDTSLILKSIGDDLLFEGLETDNEPQLLKRLTREKKLEASKVLTALFPKIEELVLCPGYNTRINIEHLLQFYDQQLTSLTMTWSKCARSQLRAFNFPKLKSLNTFGFSPAEDQLLSLLPQLESLTLRSTEISLETLLRTGTQLRELNMDGINSVYTAPVEEFSKRPRINTNLRKLSFGTLENELPLLEFISLNLTSLECLKMDVLFDQDNLYHLHSLSTNLLPLQQLHSLTLEARVSFFLLDDNQLAEIKALPSVRHLNLLLWNYASLPPESMDLFSRSLFTAFPHAEQVLIAFVGHEDEDGFVDDGRVDADTLAAFEDFAGKHPNVVQLFRSKNMSKFTAFPNAASPLLGHRRQVFEEYIQAEELFGVPIGKLAASLVARQDDGPNLRSALQSADRLTAMSNLLTPYLEHEAFVFPVKMAKTMIENMVYCALRYGPSQVELFSVTWKCILSLLNCPLGDNLHQNVVPFFSAVGVQVCPLKVMLTLIEHHKRQQLKDKDVLQLYERMVTFLEKQFFSDDATNREFKVLFKLAHYYQTQQLSVLENDEKLLLQIHKLIDDQLKKLDYESLDDVISHFIRADNRLYRVEMIRALARCCEGPENCFKFVNSDDDSDGSSSSAES